MLRRTFRIELARIAYRLIVEYSTMSSTTSHLCTFHRCQLSSDAFLFQRDVAMCGLCKSIRAPPSAALSCAALATFEALSKTSYRET
jgi:hypothetical protein